MERAFEGKSVLVIGSATGLGAESARRFAREGARLTLVDLDAGRLAALAGELRTGGAEVIEAPGNAAEAATAEAAVAAARENFGRIDVLFNNVGIDPLSATTVVDTTEAQWDAVMAVNVKAAFLFCRAVVPVMAAGGGGAIVSTASIAGLKPGAGEAAYNVSKAALVQLARCVALDHARQNIRSNCLCPGFLEAVMADRRADMTEAMLRARSENAARLVPLGREGSYAEMAEMVLFLADERRAAYVTGAAFTVDGGMMLL